MICLIATAKQQHDNHNIFPTDPWPKHFTDGTDTSPLHSALNYHWRENCHKYHMLVATKHVFCHDKSMDATEVKTFVVTNICCDRLTCVCRDKTGLLSRQKLYLRQLLPVILNNPLTLFCTPLPRHLWIRRCHTPEGLTWQQFSVSVLCTGRVGVE